MCAHPLLGFQLGNGIDNAYADWHARKHRDQPAKDWDQLVIFSIEQQASKEKSEVISTL